MEEALKSKQGKVYGKSPGDNRTRTTRMEREKRVAAFYIKNVFGEKQSGRCEVLKKLARKVTDT
ncbi:hypothetical protein ACFPU1_00930 [Thalassorhabdus alkalitolerans]|uniref:Uncharacterized protein n=1 Tax=Thalassorhabdus alkalitolerans TaxID=2282697 RepID=A0ABW0YI32_9BACI